jgi:hypothetical protein
MHLARAGRIRQADRRGPMDEDRDQRGGNGERYDESKEQLHGIPNVFREPIVELRQFSEKSRSAHSIAAVSYK